MNRLYIIVFEIHPQRGIFALATEFFSFNIKWYFQPINFQVKERILGNQGASCLLEKIHWVDKRRVHYLMGQKPKLH